MERIPLYSYEGHLVQFISPARLKRLDENGRIIKIVRHKKGKIGRAILARMPGEPAPVHLKQYIGTKYCLRENLSDGHHCFRLRGLGDELFADKDLAPDEVRPIFLTVVTGCLSERVA